MDIEKTYEYECQKCGETTNCIYAYYTTNQWLCSECLRITDPEYSRAVHAAETEWKNSKRK